MPSVRPAASDAAVALLKRDFAKAVRHFAKRAAAWPGFPYLWIACAAAAGLMTVTGGFQTSELPLGRRALFWLVLMGWNALKWQMLFALFVRKERDWWRVSLVGGIPLNLMLPLEIALAGRLVGTSMAAPAPEVWVRAAAISLGIFIVCAMVGWMLWYRAAPRPIADNGLLTRAGIDPAALVAIQAEDHYCRVLIQGGASALIHYRFGDALAEVGGLNGAQVHRSAWIAEGAIAGAVRDGRRWHLLLSDGTRVAVSATHLPQVRARGWLRGLR